MHTAHAERPARRQFPQCRIDVSNANNLEPPDTPIRRRLPVDEKIVAQPSPDRNSRMSPRRSSSASPPIVSRDRQNRSDIAQDTLDAVAGKA